MDRTPAVLADLTPVAERLLERHLAGAKEWFPHEFVPWCRGRDFAPGEAWDADEVDARPGRAQRPVREPPHRGQPPLLLDARSSNRFGDDGAWGTWVRRWTAEEGRHSIVLRDYLTVTRALDPVALERARMAQVECGRGAASPTTSQDGIVYVALQELATRIAHHNTGKLLDDPAGLRGDEAGRERREPPLPLLPRPLRRPRSRSIPRRWCSRSSARCARSRCRAPGSSTSPQHAKAIARAGIYDFSVHHEQILVPVVLRHWNIEALEGSTPEAEAARDALVTRIDRIGQAGRRMANRRAENDALAISA